jgi:NADH-quinone oxidoreductase subunit M
MTLTPLDELLLFSAGTLLLVLLFGRIRASGWFVTILFGGQLVGLLKMAGLAYGGAAVALGWQLEVMEHTLSWRFDALSWYFAIITLGAAFLSSWFAAGEWGERFRSQAGNLWLFHVLIVPKVLAVYF